MRKFVGLVYLDLKPFAICSVVLFSSMACGAGALPTLRAQASRDMQCPEGDVEIERVNSAVQVDTQSGAYYASGCRQYYRYQITCNAMGSCERPEGADVFALVSRQATRDLQCDALSVAQMSSDTFGAQGCDKEARYQLTCQRNQCRVVQNASIR